MPAKRKPKPKVLWTAKLVDYGNDDIRVDIEAAKAHTTSMHLMYAIAVIDAVLQEMRSHG